MGIFAPIGVQVADRRLLGRNDRLVKGRHLVLIDRRIIACGVFFDKAAQARVGAGGVVAFGYLGHRLMI